MKARTLRARIADPDRSGSLSARARHRRWQAVGTEFPDLERMSVIDLGGTVAFWAAAPVRPASLTLLNPSPSDTPQPGWAEVVVGDACDPPASITGRKFDLVYSNSTIEHVGGHARRQQFAKVVNGLASHLWVQTPYRYFPIEPHFVFPWFQHLPVAVRSALIRRWPLTPPMFPTDPDAIREEVLGIELLSISEMAHYFPLATLQFERVGGLVKSIIAVG